MFGRSADVRIIWSTKRDVRDLKVKAMLRMIESKRYSNGSRSSESYRRQNSDVQQYRNLDVSELLFVELVNFNEANRKMEVIRCSSLVKDDVRLVEENQEEEDTMLNEDKYQAILPSESFHDYMMNHRDLHNPSLIKHQLCSSLLHSELVLESYKDKLLENNKKSNNHTSVQEDDDVVILDERNVDISNISAGSTSRRSETQCQVKNSPKSVSKNGDSLKISVTSEPTTHTQAGRRRPRLSISSSSVSSSSESSSTSVDSQRKRHKHSHKKHKSRHKGRSKHSKKSKKKKSHRKHRRRDSSGRRSKSPEPKKIDNKILELLNMTK